MMIMPFQVSEREYILLVLLKDDNIDRIRHTRHKGRAQQREYWAMTHWYLYA